MTAVAIVKEAQVDCIAAVLPQGRGQAFGIAGQACALVNGGAGVEDYAQASWPLAGLLRGGIYGRVLCCLDPLSHSRYHPRGRCEIAKICRRRLR